MIKKYIDQKVTIWNRYHFNDDADMEKIVEALEKSKDIEDVLDDEFGFSESEILDDTKEIMYPYENGKQPTIEVYEFKGKDLNFNNCSFEIVWDNVNGKS